MGRKARAGVFVCLLVLVQCGTTARASDREVTPGTVPAVWGHPLAADPGVSNAAMVALGRRLFYDSRLSATGCYSCSSCHVQKLAFTDGRRRAMGVSGGTLPRNTPTLTNVGYNASLTWVDAHVYSLEQQAVRPLLNPTEMGFSRGGGELSGLFDGDAAYQSIMRDAFGDQMRSLSLDMVARALAAFTRSLVSSRSPVDRYVYEGSETALSNSAKRGMELFFSARLGCTQCHSTWNYSGPIRTKENPRSDPVFHDTGLPRTSSEEGTGFKAPTLRNVAVTAPYMHDGSLDSLEQVLKHYEKGGIDTPLKSPLMRPFTLSARERDDVIAFLTSLTDEYFLSDPAYSNPFTEEEVRAQQTACTASSRPASR